MAGFKIENFKGEAPKIDPSLLQTGAAQFAENVDLSSGKLEALKTASDEACVVASNTETIYLFGSGSNTKWFSWGRDVDIVGGPVAGDGYERTYMTGEQFTDDNGVTTYYPSMTDNTLNTPSDPNATACVADTANNDYYPILTRRLGVPAPTTPCTLTRTGAPPDVTAGSFVYGTRYTIKTVGTTDFTTIGATNSDVGTTFMATGVGEGTGVATTVFGEDDREERIYVYTYVTERYEEGPPSPPSLLESVGEGEGIDLAGLASMTPIAGSGINIKYIYIYRAATGASGSTGFLFVDKIGDGGAIPDTYSDTKTDSELGESLPSTDWVPPPPYRQISSSTANQYFWDYPVNVSTKGMFGLVSMPNGIMAGFTGKEVCFSEPYMPHAWPEHYRHTVDFDIVGMAVAGSHLIVTTEANPYVVSGIDPMSMSATRLDLNHACSSKRSIVDMGDSVIYASPDGLVGIKGHGGSLITGSIIDRDWWQANIKPSSIHAYSWEGMYVGFYDNGTVAGGFIFNPATGDFVRTDTHATAGYSDLETDTLYLAVGGDIQKWNRGLVRQSFKWKSSKIVLPKPSSMGALQIIGDHDTPTTVEVWADGVKISNLDGTNSYVSINSDTAVRMPSGYVAREWEVQVTGTSKVDQIIIAETLSDLARV